MVVRPLSDAIVGRTALAPYRGPLASDAPDDLKPDPNHHRPFLRQYVAHLAGLELTVDSLAFQEQDSAASACASTAVWSTLHRKRFWHECPSPGKITELASVGHHRRAMPSIGLDNHQMALAMKQIGLEVEVLTGTDAKRPYETIEAIYAYGRFGIPCILGISLFSKGKGKGAKHGPLFDANSKNNLPHYLDRHAVTLTGLRLETTRSSVSRHPNHARAPLTVDRLAGLYVHDDQVGPYTLMPYQSWSLSDSDFRKKSRLELLEAIKSAGSSVVPASPNPFSIRWNVLEFQADDGQNVVGILDCTILPVTDTIKIGYRSAREALDTFHTLADLTEEWSRGFLYEWDLRLSSVNELRRDMADILNDARLSDTRRRVLESNWPRHLWRATLYSSDETPQLELVMDATDVKRAFFVLDVIPLTEESLELISSLSKSPRVQAAAVQSTDSKQYNLAQRKLLWFVADLLPLLQIYSDN